MTPMPRLKELLTIVVPSKNEEGYIGNLLQSLSEQWYIEGVQIYVADAQSTDRTREIVNSYKDRLNVDVIEGGTVHETWFGNPTHLLISVCLLVSKF